MASSNEEFKILLARRAKRFAEYIRSDEQHICFGPGEKFWLVSSFKSLKGEVLDALPFLEQLGITEAEIKGSKVYVKTFLARYLAEYFRFWTFSRSTYVTVVDVGGEHNEICPNAFNIVRNSRLRGRNRRWKQLQSDVLAADKFTLPQSGLNKEPPEEAQDIDKEIATVSDTEVAAASTPSILKQTSTTTAPVQNRCVAAHSTISIGVDVQIPCANTTSPTEEVAGRILAAKTLATLSNSTAKQSTTQVETTGAVAQAHAGMLTNFLIKARKEGGDLCLTLKRGLVHCAHELLMVLRDGNHVVLNCKTGGTPLEWQQCVQSRGGKSKRSVERAARRARLGIIQNTRGRPDYIQAEIESKIGTEFTPIVGHQRGRLLVVPSAEDQMMLQQTGNMSQRRMIAFNRLLIKLTNISIHSSKNTLTALTEKMLPDYIVESVSLAVNNLPQDRKVFRVYRYSQVIEYTVSKLFERTLFRSASEFTALDDDTVVVRFGGDKGGKVMAFKFGLTVMNCPTPNLTDAFYLLGTMEAFDTYNNLKKGIFGHVQEELKMLFNCENEPKLLVVLDGKDKPLLVRTFAFPPKNNPCNDETINMPKESEETHNSWVRDSMECALCCCGSMIWGIAMLNEDDDVDFVLPFKTEVPIDKIDSLQWKVFNLHTVLGGDLEFLHTVTGHQNCSSMNPCLFCLKQLPTFRGEDRCFDASELRTMETTKKHLEAVLKGKCIKEQKKIAQENGSILHPPLIPVRYDRISTPVLHIILGILKKLFDNFVAALRRHETACSNETRILEESRGNLMAYIACSRDWQNEEEEAYKSAEKRRKDTYDLYTAAKSDASSTVEDIKRLEGDLKVARSEKKKYNDRRKQYNEEELAAYSDIVKSITYYMNESRGPAERGLYDIITQRPVNAQQVPWHGGAFNGKDCIKIIQNLDLIFDLLSDIDPNDNILDKILVDHREQWEAFGDIVPLMRSTRKLSDIERNDLMRSVTRFEEAYKNNSLDNITIKMHMLAHMKRQLDTYHTLGLFAEDSMESIHALVNSLARVFSSMAGGQKIDTILKRMAAKNDQVMRQQEADKIKKEERKRKSEEKGKPLCEKKRRKIGLGNRDSVAIRDTLAVRLVDATKILREGWFLGMPPDDFSFERKECRHCIELLGINTIIPAKLQDLHDLLLHTAADNYEENLTA